MGSISTSAGDYLQGSKGRMKTFCLFLLLYCSGGFSSAQVPMKVMTFNIRYNNPGDSIYNWDHRRDLVNNVIRSYNPDIAGFQEVLYGQMKDLKNALKEYEYFGVGRDNGKKAGEYSLIIYKKSRFKRMGGSTFWLSETPSLPGSKSWNSACTRIVTWVKLEDSKSGLVFYLFNTHFDHISEKARVESAKLLKTKIAELCGTSPVVVTGDFNSTPSDASYKILTDTISGISLHDTRLFMKFLPGEPSYSFIGFPFHPTEGELIDFIFTANDKHLITESYHIVTDSKNGLYPSDHLPVTSELVITREN